jgi:hypothetical protein
VQRLPVLGRGLQQQRPVDVEEQEQNVESWQATCGACPVGVEIRLLGGFGVVVDGA